MSETEKRYENVDSKKLKALTGALDKIEAEFGSSAVMDMSGRNIQISGTPTGSLPLDIALGIGGIPEGRIMEIYGPEGSGKTTLCYHMMAEVQKRGGVAAFIDTEHAMDALYASRLGVNIDELIVSQPDFGEQALNIVDVLASSGAVSIVVVDSVAALIPRAELEGQIGDVGVGQLARMMSQAMRKLASTANKNKTTIIFTNQLREKIGVTFGSPETQPGGRALKFSSSVRLDIRRIETLKVGTDPVGNRVRVKVVKNKVAPPFKQAEFDIMYGEGVDQEGSLIDLALDKDNDIDLISKAGAFFTFQDGSKAQGKPKAKALLKENPKLAEEIETAIRKFYFHSEDSEEKPEVKSAEDKSEEDK